MYLYACHKVLLTVIKFYFCNLTFMYDGSAVVKVLRYKSECFLVRFPLVSLEFCIDIILPIALWPRG